MHHTEETKRKISAALKGRKVGNAKRPNVGYRHSDETRAKISANHSGGNPGKPNDLVFVENSKYPRHTLKNRIIEQNLIPYECDECRNKGEWQGEKLVLHLDHENGRYDDNRLENLRFLCPNCHSQTPTYAGKNKSYKQAHIVQ